MEIVTWTRCLSQKNRQIPDVFDSTSTKYSNHTISGLRPPTDPLELNLQDARETVAYNSLQSSTCTIPRLFLHMHRAYDAKNVSVKGNMISLPDPASTKYKYQNVSGLSYSPPPTDPSEL